MAKEKSYVLGPDKQKQLDELIVKFAVYSSGTVYGDIIVPRNNVADFIYALTTLGIAVNSVSWWCNATDENKNKYSCPHGYGGPMTRVGWFSEMCHDFDEIHAMERERFLSLDTEFESETIKIINDKVMKLIHNKRTTTYADETFLTFQNNPCLTPGFDLYVPSCWKGKQITKSTDR